MRCYAWCNLLHPKSGIGHEKNLPRDDPRSIPPGTKICRGLSQIDARSTQLCPSVWCFFMEMHPCCTTSCQKKGRCERRKKKHPVPCLSIESIHIQPLLPADSIMAANSYIPRSGPTLMPYLRNQGMSWGTVCHWAEAYAQMPRNEASRCQKWDFLRKEGIQVVWQCVTVNCEDFSSLSQSELI